MSPPTAVAASPPRSPAPDAAPLDVGLLRPLPAAVGLVVMVASLTNTGWVRRQEAALAAAAANGLGVDDVRAVGSTVLFDAGGQLTGFTLTLGCSVVFLLLPFALVTTVLLGVRRVPLVRAVAAFVGAVVVLMVTNQVRIATVAVAMEYLGPLPGYSLTHVLVGAIVSTLGAVVAGILYLLVLVHGSDRRVERPVRREGRGG